MWVRELAAALMEMGKGAPSGQISVEELVLAGVCLPQDVQFLSFFICAAVLGCP